MTEQVRRRAKRGNGCVRARPKGQKAIWEIRYSLGKDAAGKRRIITAAFRGTETAANAELRRRLAEVDKGVHVEPSRQTVAQYLERWLKDWAETNVSPKTCERYAELLRRHVIPHIGNLAIQKLGAADLVGLYGQLLRKGRDDGKGLAPRTVGHVHRAVHRALRHAVLWKIVQSNPASSASAPRVEETEIEILQPAQLKAVITGLAGRPIYPLMITALGTGARRGELLALRWQDCDLDRGEIRIERSVEQTKAGLRIKSPKTKHGRRTIALPAAVVSELRAVWKAYAEHRLAMGLRDAETVGLPWQVDENGPKAKHLAKSKRSRVVEWKCVLLEAGRHYRPAKVSRDFELPVSCHGSDGVPKGTPRT